MIQDGVNPDRKGSSSTQEGLARNVQRNDSTGKATVIVVAYGVDHLNLSWVPADVPVVVVHNDHRLGRDMRSHPNALHLFPQQNIGFAAGVNLALTKVRTPRLVLVNPDVAGTPRHWEVLAAGMADQIVAVDQVDGQGRPTSVINRFPTPASALLTALRVGQLAPRGTRRRRWLSSFLGPWGADHRRSLESTTGSRIMSIESHWATGALLSIDTEVLRSVGGFDPGFFLYYEDADLAARLALARPGITIVVADVAPAVHLVGGSAADRRTRAFVRAHRWRSAARYADRREGGAWTATTLVLKVGAAATARTSPFPVLSPRPLLDARTSEVRPVSVAVVHTARRASGESRRVQGWLELLKAAGFEPYSVPLLGDNLHGHGRRTSKYHPSWPGSAALLEVVRGSASPETLVWNRRRLDLTLAELDPDIVLCVTLRAFSPRLARKHPVVLDLVDPLSQSYRQRGAISERVTGRFGFRLLASAVGRAERYAPGLVPTTAAGWSDAQRLGLAWIPSPVSKPSLTGPSPIRALNAPDATNRSWDALFVGTLDYPPNIDAVTRLVTGIWPRVRSQVPEAVLGIAGRRPTPRVEKLTTAAGIELVADFDDLGELVGRAHLAVAPLRHATGFQFKVLDAAAYGLPQVITPPAAAGFEPGLPVLVAQTDEAFAEAVVHLLGHPDEAVDLAARARAHVEEHYGVDRWARWLREYLGAVVGGGIADRPAPGASAGSLGGTPPAAQSRGGEPPPEEEQ